MTKICQYGDSILIFFNGSLFLAKDKHYSQQFLGSGKTENEALENMKATIEKHKFQYREVLY
jgi:hypothetical protein